MVVVAAATVVAMVAVVGSVQEVAVVLQGAVVTGHLDRVEAAVSAGAWEALAEVVLVVLGEVDVVVQVADHLEVVTGKNALMTVCELVDSEIIFSRGGGGGRGGPGGSSNFRSGGSSRFSGGSGRGCKF